MCTKRINMILTKWKEVDIKRGQIALCKDRCGRPWSSTRAYKVKRRGRRKKKKTVSGLTSGGILAPSLTVLPSTVMWYTCPSVSVNTKCSLAEIAWLISDLLSASCRRLWGEEDKKMILTILPPKRSSLFTLSRVKSFGWTSCYSAPHFDRALRLWGA